MIGRLALAVTALALALVGVEWGLRAFPLAAIETHRGTPAPSQHARFYQYDERLGWRGRPHARGRFDGWEFRSEVALNREGFREGEVPEKGERFRLVALGDSISWGYGVEPGERYSDLLRGLLRAWGIRVEVVNLAVAGYGTDQELLLFEAEGARYCPDLVLLGLYANDLHENAAAVQGRYPKPYFRLLGDGGLALANVPIPRLAEWADEAADRDDAGLRALARRHLRLYAAAAFVKHALAARRAEPPGEAPVSDDEVELTARLLRRLGEAVERTGAAFLVVVLPDLHDAAGPPAAATRSGVPRVLDLGPVFRVAARAGPPLFYRLDGAHWTRRAHAVAAAAIAEFVARAGPLPATPRRCPPVERVP